MSRLSNFLKGSLKSTTMRVNLGVAAAWFLSVLSGASFVTDNPEYTAILAGITAIVNMFLRVKTKKPLAER